jgi:hypothetical protein
MIITVIKSDSVIKQILFGPISEQTVRQIDQLNENPLISEIWTYVETRTDKSVHDLAEFLGVNEFNY